MTKSSPGRKSAQKSGESSASGDYVPEAGDLIKVSFDPIVGTEKGGFRRAIVITPKEYNRLVGRCFACPTTLQVKGYPLEVPLPDGLQVSGVIVPDQGKPLDFRARRIQFVEAAPPEILEEVRIMLGTFLVIP